MYDSKAVNSMDSLKVIVGSVHPVHILRFGTEHELGWQAGNAGRQSGSPSHSSDVLIQCASFQFIMISQPTRPMREAN